MSPDQIRRLRGSHSLLLMQADAAGALFYANLFAADPSLRPLFEGDIRQQGRKLMQSLGTAVGLIDSPELLLPMLRRMGACHAALGVRPVHYETVGTVLLKTLQQALGDAFDGATREAWVDLYGLVADTMIGAGTQAAAAA